MIQNQLTLQKYKEIIFERLNSKYNRLWEQLTNIGILIIQIITAFLVGLLTYQSNAPKNIISFNYVTLYIFAIIIGLSLAMGKLELERTQAKRDLLYFLNKLD